MNSKDRATLKPTGVFRVIETRLADEVEICIGTEEDCAEVFEAWGDRIEQLYRETDPNALTSECWIEHTEEYARE